MHTQASWYHSVSYCIILDRLLSMRSTYELRRYELLICATSHCFGLQTVAQAWPAMYASPTVSTLTRNAEMTRRTQRNSENSEYHFMIFGECSQMGRQGLVHFMLVCEFIEDPGCKVCEMQDAWGMRVHQFSLHSSVDSATGQSDPNSSPMNSTTSNKAEIQ